jgi:hypothetical protein
MRQVKRHAFKPCPDTNLLTKPFELPNDLLFAPQLIETGDWQLATDN